jgi:hypothetical protein
VIKSRRISAAGHVAYTGNDTSYAKLLFENFWKRKFLVKKKGNDDTDFLQICIKNNLYRY